MSLIDSIFDVAIAIVHIDCDGRLRDTRGGVRRRTSRHLIRRLLRSEMPPCYETLYTRGAPGPPEASDVRDIDDGGPCADADRADWIGSHGHH